MTARHARGRCENDENVDAKGWLGDTFSQFSRVIAGFVSHEEIPDSPVYPVFCFGFRCLQLCGKIVFLHGMLRSLFFLKIATFPLSSSMRVWIKFCSAYMNGITIYLLDESKPTPENERIPLHNMAAFMSGRNDVNMHKLCTPQGQNPYTHRMCDARLL